MESKLFLLTTVKFESLNSIFQREIYFEYYNFIYSSIMYITRDHAATQDILQEAFIKIISSVPSMSTESQLKSWIKVVVRNNAYNYLRKNKKNRSEIDTNSVFIHNNIEFSTTSDSIEKEVETNMLSEEISILLGDLHPDYRTLIEMRWKQDLSYKEIGELLSIDESTVKSKLHRARESIKKQIITQMK